MTRALFPVATTLALSLLCGSQVAQAQVPRTVNFTVPVKLTNYGGTEAWVWCELRDASNRSVAVGYSPIRVTNGSADQPVMVMVQLVQPAQVPTIAGWRCVLTAPDPAAYRTGGAGVGKYTAMPALQVFGEITGKF